MGSSPINKHNETNKTNESARNAKLTPKESLDKALKNAHHVSQEHHPADSSVKAVAKQLSEAQAKIVERETKIHAELASKGAKASAKATAQLHKDLKQEQAQLHALKEGVTKFNSAMAAQASHHRLKIEGKKVEFTALAAGQVHGKSKDAKAAHHTQAEAAAMATDTHGSPGVGVNQPLHHGVDQSPYHDLLKKTALATASQLAKNATVAGIRPPTAAELQVRASHIPLIDHALTGGEGVGANSAGQGVGGPTISPFLKNLGLERGKRNPHGTPATGAKGKGHVGSKSASAAGGGGGASGGSATSNSSAALSAADTSGLGGAPGGALTSASGDPYAGYPNINGLLMAVLLECYKSGQQQLKDMALRLKALNKAKDGVRAQLKGLRTADAANAKNNTTAAAGPSPATQAAEDQLNSMGDDAQMQQMDLQNLAQNQSQLLQMISDFSKNSNTNSLAIIRNIAG